MKTSKLRRKIEEKLNDPKHGLRLELTKTHHFMYRLFYKSKYISVFKLSHGSAEPGKRLIGMIARELGINSRQVEGLVSCTFWGKDFVEESLLIKHG